MRNFTKTLTAVSLMAPLGAYPLGVGDIKMHSALNQKLDAEIALVLSANESIGDIQVKLAPPAKFDKAGVPWSYFISKIKFKPVVKSSGAAVIQLSSSEVLKEPFLDFLLQVSWAQGDIYREFTVLVDPPSVYQQPAVQVATAGKPKTQITKARQSSSRTVSPNRATWQGGNAYGPTTRSDTLWKIAEKVNKYNDVSVEQMMMALYKANPGAFIKHNVNSLMAGETLKIPEKSAILKLTRHQASVEFKKHVDAWKGKVSRDTALAESEQATEIAEAGKKLKLKAPAEAEIKDNLLVAPVADNKEIDSGAAIQNQELQDRVNKLEKQLLMMQQLLALKDQQLANLQNSSTQKNVQVPSETEPPALKQEKTSEKPALKKPPVPKVKQDGVITKEQKKVKPKPKPKPQGQPPVESEYGLGSIIAGTISFGLLGLFGWMWWRRRLIEEEETESMFASSSEISLPETDQDLSVAILDENTASSYDVGTVGESSFLSEFTPSDFDAFETDQNEVDPISEADVYLAYGRYQQAEELMRQAIKDQPERDTCKLKLLEIYYADENIAEFEAFAAELVAEGKKNDPEFWAKVVEMGSEVCPDSALFKAEETSGIAAFPVDNIEAGVEDISESVMTPPLTEQEESDDTAIDSSTLGSEAESGNISDLQRTDKESQADDNFLDFDFSDTAKAEEPEQQGATAAFNLSEDSVTELAEDSASSEHSDELHGLDLTSDLEDKTESGTTIELGMKAADQDDSGSLDFTGSTAEPPGAEEKLEADDIALDFDLEIPETESHNADVDEMEVSDLTDMDEFETKIDLAKAYIDMGDEEAAKSIAEEVILKGNEEQKKEAQTILEKL